MSQLSWGNASGKSKRGLGKWGPERRQLGQKGPFGAISALPLWLSGAEELVPIGPAKAPIGPEKAWFSRKDFPPYILGPAKTYKLGLS